MSTTSHVTKRTSHVTSSENASLVAHDTLQMQTLYGGQGPQDGVVEGGVCTDDSKRDNTDSTDRTYTVDEVLRKIGLGWYHYKWVPAIAMSAATQSSMIALLPLLMTTLQCQWDLNTAHEVIILFVLFFGAIPGDVISGLISDKAGRRWSIVSGQLLLLLSTLVSVVSPNYSLFAMSYFFIGTGIGMLTFVIVVQLSEISPPDFRSYSVTAFYVCWALGALYSTTACFFLLNTHGWKVTTIAVCVPQVLVILLLLFVDESPKYLAVSGNIPAAEQILAKMALQNKCDIKIVGKLTCDCDPQTTRGSVSELFNPNIRSQFLLLFGTFLSAGVIVYSSYSMIPYMIQQGYCGYQGKTPGNATTCMFSDETLKETAMITTAEVIMIPIFAFANELFGRVKTMRFLAIILCLASFFLIFCLGNMFLMMCLYIQRGAVQSLFLILYIYAPECFPTHIRGVSCGLIFMAMVCGGLFSSLIVYPVAVLHGFSYLMIILAVCAACSLGGVFLLKTETRGTDLP